jgi:ribosomal protein S21
MLARFTNAVKSSGLLTEHRRGLHFVSPSEVRRRAAHRGLMRARKQQAARQP